jgi:transposase
MSRFLPYSPDQAYQLPPSVKDELGEDPLNVFLHRVVEGSDLREFENAYSDEGGELYAPSLRLKVWLYAYAPGMTSARGLEQRVREDLGMRNLAGGQRPDNWALGALRRRHGRALNDVFTQGMEMARVGAFGNGGHRFDARSGLRFAR